jgi:AcrR family transcriptional regulator
VTAIPSGLAAGFLIAVVTAPAGVSGIGRATLYKYFPDVEAVLVAWHERQIAQHLEQLAKARDQAGDAKDRLEAVLTTYAQMTHERPHDTEIATLLHRGDHIDQGHRHLSRLIEDLIAETASAGDVRADVRPAELADYCLMPCRPQTARLQGRSRPPCRGDSGWPGAAPLTGTSVTSLRCWSHLVAEAGG